MTTMAYSASDPGILSARLSRLAPLAPEDIQSLRRAERHPRRIAARREIDREGEPSRGRRALIGGWACRQRILSDGRRQIISVLLPGDLIGMGRHDMPVAPTTISAASEVVTCALPPPPPSARLAEAYRRSAALEEHYLYAQITRLGRLNAHERLADWLLEMNERLALVGLSVGDSFAMPFTQEMLADALGLTSVHINRTLQAMRRDGLVTMAGGVVTLPDRARLEQMVDYKPARISVTDR